MRTILQLPDAPAPIMLDMSLITTDDPLSFDEVTDGLSDQDRYNYLHKKMSFFKPKLLIQKFLEETVYHDIFDNLWCLGGETVVKEVLTEGDDEYDDMPIVRVKHSKGNEAPTASDIARALNGTTQHQAILNGLQRLQIPHKPENIVFLPNEIGLL